MIKSRTVLELLVRKLESEMSEPRRYPEMEASEAGTADLKEGKQCHAGLALGYLTMSLRRMK